MGRVVEGVRRQIGWGALYVAAGLVGRLSIIDGGSLALVWPAAGVAALWLATATRRTMPVDLAVFAGLVLLVNLVTGASPRLAGVFVFSNFAQTLLFVAVMRRWTPHLHLFGGAASLRTLRDLTRFTAAAVGSCLVGASLGITGLRLLGIPVGLPELLVWWGRNTAGAVVVGVLGLLLLAQVRSRYVPDLRDRRTLAALGEGVVLWVASGVLVWAVFGPGEALPLSFLLIFATVLVAVRQSPLAVSLHGLALGAAAIALTLDAHGPFATIAAAPERALVAQVFVVMTLLTGLVLAFSRLESIRARARAEDLRAESEQRAGLLLGVLTHMRDGVAVMRADGEVLVSNPAGDELLGTRVSGTIPAETVSATYNMTHLDGSELLPGDAPYVRAAAGETLRDDYLLTPPGAEEPMVLEVTGGPLPTPDSEVPRAVITYRDVTSQRHDRDALATFAGVVAHDLKRPLTVISGWTAAALEDLREETVDPEAVASMLTRVSSSAEQMGRLLEDLLHYTVVRDAPVSVDTIDLSVSAEESAETFRDRESRPRVEVQPGMVVLADHVMVRQVLDNLIGNAVKYVAPDVRPHVRVTATVEDGWTVLRVADNGIGIAPVARQRIFEAFNRAHADDYRGTGLGLAIVRRAAERCGGVVRLADSSATGSTFEVRLPHPSRPEDEVGPGTRPVAV